LLCGQVGLAGGVNVGDGAVLGGRVGVADHLKIGAWAVVGAAACVGTNVPTGAVYAGYPAVPRDEAMENLKLMRRVRRLVARLTEVAFGGIDGLQSNTDNNGRRP
jgi:UDP-3-O-[3-hydroxymyristoyl] glucosamine N-acyltransferase